MTDRLPVQPRQSNPRCCCIGIGISITTNVRPVLFDFDGVATNALPLCKIFCCYDCIGSGACRDLQHNVPPTSVGLALHRRQLGRIFVHGLGGIPYHCRLILKAGSNRTSECSCGCCILFRDFAGSVWRNVQDHVTAASNSLQPVDPQIFGL